jgi:hypothetical protein
MYCMCCQAKIYEDIEKRNFKNNMEHLSLIWQCFTFLFVMPVLVHDYTSTGTLCTVQCIPAGTGLSHRYLMDRLPIHGFYLWRHILSTAPPFIFWWWKFEILFEPLPRSSPFIGGQCLQPIQMGHSLHIRGRGGSGLDNLLMSTVFAYLW